VPADGVEPICAEYGRACDKDVSAHRGDELVLVAFPLSMLEEAT